jgi:arylsulfatase A-like enzyme
MKRLGYRSYGVATNLNIGSAIGFDRGFDRFASLSGEPAETVLKTLRSWKSEIEAEPPYFLYLHLNDVHKPYTQRAPWFEESGDSRADTVSAYDSEIHYVDGVLEKMLELFDFAPGGDRGGILVIASDHGEEFWDHGGDGHRFSLHYEVNRIALMLSGPGIRPGVRSENVSGVDVLPTLLDLIGAPPPDLVDGRSLSPLLLSGSGEDALRAELGSRPLLAHRAHRRSPDKELWAVVVGPWRLIVTPDGSQLYDLRSDTQEIRDLSGIEAQQVAVLQAELDRFRAATPVERVETKVLLDSEDLRALRALGYVEDEDDSR